RRVDGETLVDELAACALILGIPNIDWGRGAGGRFAEDKLRIQVAPVRTLHRYRERGQVHLLAILARHADQIERGLAGELEGVGSGRQYGAGNTDRAAEREVRHPVWDPTRARRRRRQETEQRHSERHMKPLTIRHL